MQPNEIIEVLNRPISQEPLARDVTRLVYVAKAPARLPRPRMRPPLRRGREVRRAGAGIPSPGSLSPGEVPGLGWSGS